LPLKILKFKVLLKERLPVPGFGFPVTSNPKSIFGFEDTGNWKPETGIYFYFGNT
jgi:hypothetical protein